MQMALLAPELVLLMATGLTLILAVWIGLRAVQRRHFGVPAAILGALLLSYSAALVGTSVASSAVDLTPGTQKCFDEWCAGMTGVEAVASPSQGRAQLLVHVRLANHGRRAQRSNLARAFVSIGGREIAPVDPTAMQSLVAGGAQLDVDLRFDVPRAIGAARFVISESAALTPGVLVIGDESSPFHSLAGWPLTDIATPR